MTRLNLKKAIRIGDWVKTTSGDIYEIVEINGGRLIWCSDSISVVRRDAIVEVRRAAKKGTLHDE